MSHSEHLDGFSGADLSALVREAQLSALKAAMDSNVEDHEAILIAQSDFRNAMNKVFPSVSKKDEALYARLETSLRRTRSHITGGAAGAANGTGPDASGLPKKK